MCSSVVERCPDKTEVDGPIPSTLTMGKNDIWWKTGVQIFSDISTWIIVPVILALIIGKYLDNKYNTKPWIFFILIILSFLLSAYGIVKTVKKYKIKLERQDSIPARNASHSDAGGEKNKNL